MNRKISNFQAILILITLLLTLKIYALEVINPVPTNGTANPTNVQVRFRLQPDTVAVAPTTVNITINDDTFNHEDEEVNYYLMGSDYLFTFDAATGFFDYGDSVNVIVNAQNIDGVPMEPYTWHFFIYEDSTSPFIVANDPIPAGVDMEVDDNIIFDVTDEASGVIRDSVSVQISSDTGINDGVYDLSGEYLFYQPISSGYRYTLDLPENFDNNEYVNITIYSWDYSGNYSEESYTLHVTFVYETYTTFWNPGLGDTNVDVNTTISFNIYNMVDSISVDSTSILVRLQEQGLPQQQYPYDHNNVDILPLYNNLDVLTGYQVTVVPVSPFGYNKQVTVRIDATNSESNDMETFIYSFTTWDDITAPYISDRNPAANEEDVALDSPVSFMVTDARSGVDLSSLEAYIDSVLFMEEDLLFTYEEIPNGYDITITMPLPFPSEEVINVEITAYDNLGNQRIDSYHFTTVIDSEDETPPFLWSINPDDEATNLPLDTEISFYVYDFDPGVDPATIGLRVNGSNLNSSNFTVEEAPEFGLTEDEHLRAYYVSYQLSGYSEGTITWQARADDYLDNHFNQYYQEEPYTFTIVESEPPYINLPAEFVFLEDHDYVIDFRDYAGDPDGEFPELSVIGDNYINVVIADYMVTLSTVTANWNGEETLTFTVNDGSGTVNDAVDVRVIPVNDPPVINLPVEGFTFAEDSSNWIDFDQYVSDVDAGDQLLLQATGNTSVLIAFNGLDVNISSLPDWNGEESITFTVFDSGQRTGTSQTIPITFEASPDLPGLNLPNMIIIAEDAEEIIDFDQYIYDPEELTFELRADANNNVNIDIQGTIVTLTPDDNYTGDTELTFRIRYTEQIIWVEDITTVRVLPVNDPPDLNLPAQVSVDEDSLLFLDFSLYVNDLDNDNTEISLNYYGNQHIAVNIDSMTVTLTPEGDWNGNEGIYFVAQDNGGAAITQQLSVIVNPINDDPVINFPNHIEFAEDTTGEFDLSLYITDVDGDVLTMFVDDNDSLSYEIDGLYLSLTSPLNWFDQEELEITVNDGMGGVAIGNLLVIVNSVNDVPIMNLPDNISFDEDNTLVVNFADSLWITDIDEDELTILVSGNSNIDSEVYNGTTIEFSTEENWNGSEEITFHVFDGHSSVEVFSTMEIIVNPINDPPTINLPPVFNLEENDEFPIDMMAWITDVDLYDYPNPDELTITCEGSAHITVEINDMEAVIIPDPDWTDTETLEFVVEDEVGEWASDNVDIVVTSWQNNHDPELISLTLPTHYFNEDEELPIDFVGEELVTDQDGDDLIITIYDNQILEAAGSGLGSEIIFSAGENVNGSEEITILVADQHGGYAQGTMNIVIRPVEDVLQFDITGFFSVITGSVLPKDMSEYVVDVDDGPLYCTWEGNENINITRVGESPTSVNIQGIGDWTGDEMVIFTFTDYFQEVSDSVLIQVLEGDWNHAPTFKDSLPSTFTFNEDDTFSFNFAPYIKDEDDGDQFIMTVSDVNNHLHYQINGLVVNLWGDENWYDEDMVMFTVYDTQPGGPRASATAYINVVVEPVNDVPWIELPPGYTFVENDHLTVDLNDYYGDVDGDTPVLSGTNGEHITAVITAPWVTFTAEEDWVGTDTLRFMVNDGIESASDSIVVIVTESTENNPPVIAEDFPDSIGFNEDTSYQLDFNDYINDEDDDEWMVNFNYDQYISTTVNANNVTFHPAADWNDTKMLHFTIYELRSRDQVAGEINVTVFPVNDPPVINITQDIIIEENDDPLWDFSPFISDIDSYNLTLTATGNDTIAIEINGEWVHFDPLDNWYGVETVTFTVSDGILEDSQLVDIQVIPGSFNHAPEFRNLPETISFDEDTDLVMDFAPFLYDEEGDELALNVEYKESVVATIEGLVVTFRPSMNWHDEVDLEFTVFDSEPGNRSFASQDVHIVVNPVNDAPELDLPDSWEFSDNSSLTENLRDYTFDADGDLLTITWDGNENIDIDRDGYQITFSSSGGWYGTEMINFHATDEDAIPPATATDSVQVTVTLGANNHPPQLALPDTLTLQEDVTTEFNFGPYMSDEDGDDLIITAGYYPEIAISVTDSLVTLIPAVNYNGSVTMIFTVFDSQGGRASVSDNVIVYVEGVNDPPTISLPDRFTFSSGDDSELIDFEPFINDPDEENLDLTYEGNDEINVIISNLNVIFSADEEFSGAENITFTVTDSANVTASGIVQVTAVSGNTNTPPWINLPVQLMFAEDGELEIDFLENNYIGDLDVGDELTLLSYESENVIVEIVGTTVTFTALENWNGNEDITFYVFDDIGRETASDEVEVVVTPVNDAPVINLPAELSIVEGDDWAQFYFTNYISDPDIGDTIDLSVTGIDFVEVEIEDDIGYNIIRVNLRVDVGNTGLDTLTFTVFDGVLSNSDDVTVQVEGGEWNHAPEFTDEMPTAVSIKEDMIWEADFTTFVADVDTSDAIVLTVANVENMDIVIEGMEVRITPDANRYGNPDITFTAYDTENSTRASASAVLDFTVRPQNDDPVLNLPEYIAFEEDSEYELDFANYFSDIDGDDVIIRWEGDENINVSQGTGSHYYTIYLSEVDFVGVEEITFTVTDDSLGYDTDIVEVEVLAGQWNHTPKINLPEQFILTEDTPQQIDFGPYISDEDDTDLLIITAGANDYISVTVTEDTLVTLSSVLDFNGTTTMTFHVIDNVIDRAIASAQVEVVVEPVNDAPTIGLPLELSMAKSDTLEANFSYFVHDVDGDDLILTHGSSNHLDVQIAGFNVTILNEDEEWFGDEEISFSVRDDNLSATDEITIRVYEGSSNTPPEINLPAEGFTFDEDGELVVDFEVEGYISDADLEDELFISVTGNHHVIIEIEGFDVTFSAEQDWNDIEENILFYVFDDMSGRSTATATTHVTVNPVNDPPIITLPVSFTLNEDLFSQNNFYSLNLGSYISDIDTDDDYLQLSVSETEHIQVAVIPGTFVVNISIEEAFIDTEAVSFTVIDDSLAQTSDTVDIIIEAGEGNYPPVLTLPVEINLEEDTLALIDFSNYVSDPEGDDIVITLAENYDDLLFSINQLYVTIIPAEDWFGTQEVEFIIYDTEAGTRASDSGTVNIVVEALNDAPVLDLPDNFILEENSMNNVIHFSEYMEDVDGDELSISWEGNEMINITITGYNVYMTPGNSFVGEEMVRFTAADISTAAIDSMLVIVELGTWNHAPELNLPAEGWTMEEDEQLQVNFGPYMDDIDEGDVLQIFSINNQYIDLVIDDSLVTFFPIENYFGTQELEFSLADNYTGGRTVVTASANLEVRPVNDAPTISLPNNFGFSQSGFLNENFNHYVNDIDSETLELTCSGNENISVNIDQDLRVTFILEETNDDWHGDEMISFIVSDDSLDTAVDSVLVTVYQGNVNNPPQIDLPDFFDYNEDGDLQINFAGEEGYIWDNDGDDMTLTVSGNENVAVEITGTWVTLSASSNWYGNESLTFYVIDENEQANSDNVIVRVAAVNDAPVIEFPESGFTFAENTEFRVALSDYFSDIDDNSGFSLDYSGNDNINLEILQEDPIFFIELTTEPDWFGQDTLSFTVTDGDGASDSDYVNIYVTGSSNHLPQITLPDTFSFNEDEEGIFDLASYISDPDGDDIIIIPQGSSHISISISPDTVVTFSTPLNWNGTETVIFAVWDSDSGERLAAYDSMPVMVEPVNDPPQFDLPDSLVFVENSSFSFDLTDYAYDVEGYPLTFESGVGVDITIGIYFYTANVQVQEGWFGEEWITFTATDDSVTVSDSTLIKVVMADINHAPVIDFGVTEFTLDEDTELQVDLSPYISDLDGDSLIITSVQIPEILVIVSGSNVIFNPRDNYNGTSEITFTVIDEGGAAFSAVATVTVIPVNDPPVIILTGTIGFSVGGYKTVNFAPFISDIDNEIEQPVLTCDHNGNIQVEIENLSVTFSSEVVGSEDIIFTVADTAGVTASDYIEVIVFSGLSNNVPIINLPLEGFACKEDTTLSVDFIINDYISDPDVGDQLTLMISDNYNIQVNTNILTNVRFTPNPNWYGSEEITFIVSDGFDTAYAMVTITVTSVNDIPTLTLPGYPPGFSFTEGETELISFGTYMDDADGDPLTITAENNEHINVITYINSDVISLNCEEWYGYEDVTFTVDDNLGGTVRDTVRITVNQGATNFPPEFTLPASFQTREDTPLQPINMADYIDDPEGDLIYIDCNNEENTTVIINGYNVEIIPDENWNGSELLTFNIFDYTNRNYVSRTTTIQVLPVNDAPVINLPSAGFNFNEDGFINPDFDQYIDDIDNDNNELSLSCTGNTHIIATIVGMSVNFSAEANWSGSEQLTFTVTDDSSGTAIDDVDVTVNFANDAPYVAMPLVNIFMQEDSTDTSINLNNVFGDHDLIYGDYLSFSWLGDMNLQVSADSGAVTITPDLNWYGTETLTFQATDSEDLSVEESVYIEVSSVNDIPVVVVEESIIAQADTSGFANVWLSANDSYDIDGEIVSVLWSWTENGGGSVDSMLVEQAFAPGYYEILVEATDNESGVGTATTYLSVADYGNDSPITSDDSYEVYNTGELFVHGINGVLSNDYDPDNGPDALTAELVNGPNDGYLQFIDDGSFIFRAEDIPDYDYDYDVTFTYQAYDGNAYSLIGTVNITVHPIVLEDAEIYINSFESPDGMPIIVPIHTSELISGWSVHEFEFDLQFSVAVQYTDYNFDDVINGVDSQGEISIEQNRGNLHCIYSSSNEITGEGVLLNIEFDYLLGQAPFEISNFSYNGINIEQLLPGAVNNHDPDLLVAITFTDTIFEDFEPITINLDEHFTDDDEGDDLSYTVDFDEEMISANITDNILELSSVTDQFGSPEVTITATDGYTGTLPYVYTFYPNILQVNDLPVINLPESITFPEDDSLVVDMEKYVYDPDSENLTFTPSGNTGIVFSVDNSVLTFSATSDWNGTETITIVVSDSVSARLIAIDSLDVIVEPVNDAPIINFPVSISFDEDESVIVDFFDAGYVYDIEDDDIILSITGNDSVIAEFNGTEVTLYAPENWNVTEDVTFQAQDDQGSEIVSASIQIIIHPLNDPPVIRIPRTLYIDENTTADDNTINFADSLWIYDVDGNILELTVNEGDFFIDIQIEGGGSIVTFEPPENWTGREYRTFTVNDGVSRDQASDTVEIIVVEDTLSNIPPEIQLPVIGITFPEDSQLVVDFGNIATPCYVSDDDDDDIILIIGGSENITANINDLIVIFSTVPDFYGEDLVIIQAVDTYSREITTDTLLVTVTPINDPPEIDLPENIVLAGGSTSEIDFGQYLTDIETNISELTLTHWGEEHVEIEINLPVVLFTAPDDWEGAETIYFSVSDGVTIPGQDPAQDSLVVIVEQENHAPQITLPANFTFDEDDELRINFIDSLYITDQDEDDMFISVTGNESITVTISGYDVTLGADEDWYGMETLTFIVYDSRNRASDSDEILVNVNAVNDPPEIDLPDNIILAGDTTLVVNFEQYLTDIDTNISELLLTPSGEEHVEIEINLPLVLFIAPDDWEGEETIYFSVSDGVTIPGQDPAQDSLVVIVEQENHPPEINLPANFTFDEDDELRINFIDSLYITDQDEDDMFISVTGNESITVNISDYIVTLSADEDWNGMETVTFIVHDSRNRALDSDDIQVNVNAVNDPPRFDPIYDFIMENDQTLEIEFANYVSDLEGDSFYLSLSEGEGLDITQAGTKFTIIPGDECPAWQSLTLIATENTSGIDSENPVGLYVHTPAIKLDALANAVQSGLFTFNENSGEQSVDFSQFLQSSYDITLTTGYDSSPDNDSLSVALDGFDVTFTPQSSWIGTVYVPFTANYLYDRARRDFEVKVTVRANKSGEDVVPLPHTVTWNDEKCVIRIDTGESPGDITGKILNRRGRLIKELYFEPERIGENRFIYQWYKDDTDGNPVDGGLYIYQVDVNGKIYQGTIIIVR